MGSPKGPLHLLLFDESPTDHLIDSRLDEGGADPLFLAVALTKVRDEVLVVPDVGFEVAQTIGLLACRGR
jgi:hypothetical protein